MIDKKKLIKEICRTECKVPKIGEWIPVDIAMPKEEDRINGVTSDRVLVTVKGLLVKAGEEINEYYVTNDYTINGKWNIDMDTGSFKVIAWMPLPTPYREEKK